MQAITKFFQSVNSSIKQVRLFTFPICPFVEAIRIAALENNIETTEILVNIRENSELEDKIATWPKTYLDYDGHLTTPTLAIDFKNNQRILCNDTFTILKMFDQPTIEIPKFLNDQLKPESSNNILDLKQLVSPGCLIHNVMKHAYMATMTADQQQSKELMQNNLAADINALEQYFHDHWHKNTPYFNGEQFKLFDQFLAPQLARIDQLAKYYNIHLIEPEQHPLLTEYMAHVLARNSVQSVLGTSSNFAGLLNDLYQFKGSYLTDIGQKNGIQPVSAVELVLKSKSDNLL